MINFNTVAMKNFWSVGNQKKEIPLNTNQSYLIIGDNHDHGDRGYSRNGVGKSAIFLAIQYALFGDTIESVKADGYINLKNKKKMEVEIDFHVGNDHYRVIRGRKPNFCKVYKNDQDVSRDTIENTTKYIEDVLGFDLDIFKNVYLFDPNIEPFMSLKPAQQKAFIEKLLNLNVLTERAESLKEQRKEIKSDLQVYEKQKEMVESQREKIQNRIGELESQKQLEELKYNRQKQEIEEELSDIDSVDIEEEKRRANKKDQLNQKIKDLKSQKKDLENQYQYLEKDIEQINEEFNELSQLKNRKSQSDQEYQRLVNEFSRLEEQAHENEIQKKLIKEVEELKTWQDQIQKQIDTTRQQIQTHEKEKIDKEQELESLRASKCPYCQQSYHDEEKINEIEEKIHDYQNSIETNQKLVDEKLNEYQTHQDQINTKEQDITKPLSDIEQTEKELDRYRQKINDFDGSYIQERIETLEKKFQDDPEQIKSSKVEEENQLLEQIRSLDYQIDGVQKELDGFGEVFTLDECYQLESRKRELKSNLENLSMNHEFYDEQITKAEKELEENVFNYENYEYLQKKYDHIELLIKLLTDNKSFVRRKIVDQYIPFLNQKINSYVDHLGLPHVVGINDDLSVDIQYLGEQVQYGNMSNGQRLRLNLAVSLAFNQLCSILGRKSNIIFVDEYMDSSLDSGGISKAFGFLKSFANDVFIISHREEFIPYVDKKLKVTLKNGYTDFEIQQRRLNGQCLVKLSQVLFRNPLKIADL